MSGVGAAHVAAQPSQPFSAVTRSAKSGSAGDSKLTSVLQTGMIVVGAILFLNS
jgi:hypothetical protein